VDLLEEEDRAEGSSAKEMAARSWIGRGGGSLCCAAAIGALCLGKKQSVRMLSISAGTCVTSPKGEHSSWTHINFWPCYHRVSSLPKVMDIRLVKESAAPIVFHVEDSIAESSGHQLPLITRTGLDNRGWHVLDNAS